MDTTKKPSLRQIIATTVNTRGYENLERVLGKELGNSIRELVDAATRADKELDVMHELVQDLDNFTYSQKDRLERMRKAFRKINKINNPKSTKV
jgi:hypothetical protein